MTTLDYNCGVAGKRAVYACDIGSTRGSKPTFAWVRLDPASTVSQISAYSSIEGLLNRLAQDIHAQCDIALGFEAPLFIPVPQNASDLSRGRIGEKDRPFSSYVGLAVTALAMHQCAWILSKLRVLATVEYVFTTNIDSWLPSSSTRNLFCWEAFISGTAHGKTHGHDAATAATYFCRNESNLRAVNAVTAENPFSLISAAAIWSGWTNDTAYLHKPVLVLRPTESLPVNIMVVTR